MVNVDTRGESVILNCSDSDDALRALLPAFPTARDIEVTGAGLEAAFLELTRDPDQPTEAAAVNTTYVRYELLRLIRNKRFFIFSLIFPLALFLVIAGSNRHQIDRPRHVLDQVPAVLHGEHGRLRRHDRRHRRRRAHRGRAQHRAGTGSCA